MNKYAIGVDLGGTTVKAGIVSSEGNIVEQLAIPTDADKGPEHVAKQIVKVTKEISSFADGNEIIGIGVASPGMISLDGNTVEAPPNFKDWGSFPLRDTVIDQLGNALPVKLENDANAAALAEMKFGAGQGQKNFLFVIWGTGVGGGVIIDGDIYHGPYGGAGEFGHMSIDYDGPNCNCGNTGCIESFIGQRYLSARAARKLEGRKDSIVWKLIENDPDRIEPKLLHKAAMEKDETATELMREAGELLGVAIASFMNVMNFDLAIVGGGVSYAGDLVFEPMNDRIKKNVLAPLRPKARAIHAKLGNKAGILGAAGLVM